jgi:hypothetical protein
MTCISYTLVCFMSYRSLMAYIVSWSPTNLPFFLTAMGLVLIMAWPTRTFFHISTSSWPLVFLKQSMLFSSFPFMPILPLISTLETSRSTLLFDDGDFDASSTHLLLLLPSFSHFLSLQFDSNKYALPSLAIWEATPSHYPHIKRSPHCSPKFRSGSMNWLYDDECKAYHR